jgi:hypothetical protein
MAVRLWDGSVSPLNKPRGVKRPNFSPGATRADGAQVAGSPRSAIEENPRACSQPLEKTSGTASVS